MTGFRSNKMRYDCRRDGCYYHTLPDWSDINDSFPGAIRPTDIDGMVEINGNVLFLEQKGAGASMTEGQGRAFKALSRKERVTVLAMRPGTTTEMQLLFYVKGSVHGWHDAYRTDLLEWFRLWSANAKRSEVT
jgi:hypothetical protein